MSFFGSVPIGTYLSVSQALERVLFDLCPREERRASRPTQITKIYPFSIQLGLLPPLHDRIEGSTKNGLSFL